MPGNAMQEKPPAVPLMDSDGIWQAMNESADRRDAETVLRLLAPLIDHLAEGHAEKHAEGPHAPHLDKEECRLIAREKIMEMIRDPGVVLVHDATQIQAFWYAAINNALLDDFEKLSTLKRGGRVLRPLTAKGHREAFEVYAQHPAEGKVSEEKLGKVIEEIRTRAAQLLTPAPAKAFDIYMAHWDSGLNYHQLGAKVGMGRDQFATNMSRATATLARDTEFRQWLHDEVTLPEFQALIAGGRSR
jgi:DNA-directed RNA polymerase specialized sigma24 family protein